MKKIFLIISILAQAFALFALPEGWTVNSSDFEYSLTITGVIELEGINVASDDDVVAVFVDGNCRGVAVATYVPDYKKNFFFLTVFSNEYSGEEIQIRYYNKEKDQIYDDFPSFIFNSGQNLGSVSSPTDFKAGVVGIFKEDKSKLNLSIFPNPVVNILNIDLQGTINQITVYNTIGQIVYEDKYGLNTVDVSVLEKGVYFIQIFSRTNSETKQFVKK